MLLHQEALTQEGRFWRADLPPRSGIDGTLAQGIVGVICRGRC